jgi:chromosome segregation ATPase
LELQSQKYFGENLQKNNNESLLQIIAIEGELNHFKSENASLIENNAKLTKKTELLTKRSEKLNLSNNDAEKEIKDKNRRIITLEKNLLQQKALMDKIRVQDDENQCLTKTFQTTIDSLNKEMELKSGIIAKLEDENSDYIKNINIINSELSENNSGTLYLMSNHQIKDLAGCNTNGCLGIGNKNLNFLSHRRYKCLYSNYFIKFNILRVLAQEIVPKSILQEMNRKTKK